MDVETPVIGGGRANVDEFKGDSKMKKMKQFKLFTALAGLTFYLLALAPHAAVAQDAAELKAELQGYGFENSETVLDWLLNSDHEGPFHMVNLLKFHSEANYPDDYQGERGTGLDAALHFGEGWRMDEDFQLAEGGLIREDDGAERAQ